MKLKSLTTLLLSAIFAISAQAQNTDRLIKDVCDSLLASLTGNSDDNCLYNAGKVLSCFDVTGKPEWIADFDNDGEKDLIVRVSVKNTEKDTDTQEEEYYIVSIKDGKINKSYLIPGGGASSDGTLTINKINNGKIEATYVENSGSRNIPLTFVFAGERIVEQSYLRCPLADTNKRIFSYRTPYKVERNSVLNEQYEEEQVETLYIDSEDDYISASFHGCNNIYTDFSYSIPYSVPIEQNPIARKEALINLLRFLQGNTRLTSVFSLLIKKVENTDEFEDAEGAILYAAYSLPDSWEAKILIDKFTTPQGDEIGFTINLDKYIVKEQQDFWDKMMR